MGLKVNHGRLISTMAGKYLPFYDQIPSNEIERHNGCTGVVLVSGKIAKRNHHKCEQAGAELCQAHIKLG